MATIPSRIPRSWRRFQPLLVTSLSRRLPHVSQVCKYGGFRSASAMSPMTSVESTFCPKRDRSWSMDSSTEAGKNTVPTVSRLSHSTRLLSLRTIYPNDRALSMAPSSNNTHLFKTSNLKPMLWSSFSFRRSYRYSCILSYKMGLTIQYSTKRCIFMILILNHRYCLKETSHGARRCSRHDSASLNTIDRCMEFRSALERNVRVPPRRLCAARREGASHAQLGYGKWPRL